MSNPLSFDELQQTYDGRISQQRIDLADARAIWREINRAEAWINTCRTEVRKNINTLRTVHAAPFQRRGYTLDQVHDWQGRALINTRDSWRRYRAAVRARKLLD